jgi:hypothetical protein
MQPKYHMINRPFDLVVYSRLPLVDILSSGVNVPGEPGTYEFVEDTPRSHYVYIGEFGDTIPDHDDYAKYYMWADMDEVDHPVDYIFDCVYGRPERTRPMFSTEEMRGIMQPYLREGGDMNSDLSIFLLARRLELIECDMPQLLLPYLLKFVPYLTYRNMFRVLRVGDITSSNVQMALAMAYPA